MSQQFPEETFLNNSQLLSWQKSGSYNKQFIGYKNILNCQTTFLSFSPNISGVKNIVRETS